MTAKELGSVSLNGYEEINNIQEYEFTEQCQGKRNRTRVNPAVN